MRLEKSYLQKMNGKIAERPQQMLMRVALGIHKRDIDAVIESYHLMSEKWFTHATPTMFNAGTTRPQMSSCFLLSMQGDSIEGIYGTLKRCAQTSQSSGGVGLSVSNIRASGSYIAGTNGTSNGLVPMLRVFNNTARFVNQGGGKRQGSFAVYIEPWHADIFDFLDLRKNHGKEEARARDLFYALWVPDLFMKRVEANGEWSLFCPHECPGLYDSWGAEFEALYEKYEAEGKARKTIKAQELWFAVLDSQIETGTPCATRLRHGCPAPSPPPAPRRPPRGTIAPGARAILRPLPSPPRLVAGTSCPKLTRRTRSRTSRTSARSAARTCEGDHRVHVAREVAVCNLASINARPRFAIDDPTLRPFPEALRGHQGRHQELEPRDRQQLHPVEEARILAHMKHRPVGHRRQGLADAFSCSSCRSSDAARKRSGRHLRDDLLRRPLGVVDLAARRRPLRLVRGARPPRRASLQLDMWGVTPTTRWDWAALKAKILEHGVRNSLLARADADRRRPRRSSALRVLRAVHSRTSTRGARCRASSPSSTSTCSATS